MHKEMIIDKGLLPIQNKSGFELGGKYEDICNLLKTIKEYRDFSNPNSASWGEYIRDFLSVFQFSLIKVTNSLQILYNHGSTSSPSAVLAILPSDSTIHLATTDFEWEPYLFYAAKYCGTRWGILFNGLELKAIDFSDEEYTDKYSWVNVDEIIISLREDSFFYIYKLFSLIQAGKEESPKNPHRHKKQNEKKHKGRFPQSGYRIPILKVLIELNGKGEVREILAQVYEILKEQLNDVDLRLISGGQYSWTNTAQWERLIMKKEGLLKSDSPRGVWEISTIGRKYYQEHN